MLFNLIVFDKVLQDLFRLCNILLRGLVWVLPVGLFLRGLGSSGRGRKRLGVYLFVCNITHIIIIIIIIIIILLSDARDGLTIVLHFFLLFLLFLI